MNQQQYDILRKCYNEMDTILRIRRKLNDFILSQMSDNYSGQEARNDMLDFLYNEYSKLQEDINELDV